MKSKCQTSVAGKAFLDAVAKGIRPELRESPRKETFCKSFSGNASAGCAPQRALGNAQQPAPPSLQIQYSTQASAFNASYKCRHGRLRVQNQWSNCPECDQQLLEELNSLSFQPQKERASPAAAKRAKDGNRDCSSAQHAKHRACDRG